jgi:hypothetical protein
MFLIGFNVALGENLLDAPTLEKFCQQLLIGSADLFNSFRGFQTQDI